MIYADLYIYFLTIIIGILYGFFLYQGKTYTFKYHKPWLDFAFTLGRFVVLFGFFYQISSFMIDNSILISLLFVLSYLSVVGLMICKS